MVSGNYKFNDNQLNKIKSWVEIGNTIIDDPAFIIKEESKVYVKFDLLKKYIKNLDIKLNI